MPARSGATVRFEGGRVRMSDMVAIVVVRAPSSLARPPRGQVS